MNRKPLIGMLVTGLTALALAGCGTPAAPPAADGATTTTSATAEAAAHNDADVAFVQGMIPHHMQAIDMSELTAGRAAAPQVTDLAAAIAQAQGPEIQQMQGFLQTWNLPAVPTGSAGIGDMGNTSGMPGMMSGRQMQQLGAASGAAFDRMFLEMMIDHHTGAVEMGQTELRDGENPDARALAQKIIDTQQAEISRMQDLLTTI